MIFKNSGKKCKFNCDKCNHVFYKKIRDITTYFGWCPYCCGQKLCIVENCQDCFNKGDHKGHRVWLKTNVGGCCDCGDPDGWDEKGFCSDHKGFEASSEAMLKSLPAYVKDAAPHCFAQLSN